MTARDIANTEYLQLRYCTRNKASAISAALNFLADMDRMLSETGGKLIMEHQDGSREVITILNEFY